MNDNKYTYDVSILSKIKPGTKVRYKTDSGDVRVGKVLYRLKDLQWPLRVETSFDIYHVYPENLITIEGVTNMSNDNFDNKLSKAANIAEIKQAFATLFHKYKITLTVISDGQQDCIRVVSDLGCDGTKERLNILNKKAFDGRHINWEDFLND